MSQRTFDSFTDAAGTTQIAHVGELGATWSAASYLSAGGGNTGAYNVISNANRLRGNDTLGGGVYVFATTVNIGDNELTYAEIQTLSTFGSIGIGARGSQVSVNAQTAGRGYMAYFSGGNASVLRLEYIAGVVGFAAVGSSVAQTLTVAAHKVHVWVAGTGATITIKVYYDGSLILNVTDSTTQTIDPTNHKGRLTSPGSAWCYFDGGGTGPMTSTTGTHLDAIYGYDLFLGVALNDPQPVIQRSAGSVSVTFAGTYVGTVTNIELQIAYRNGTSVVSTFATLVASPSGGTFSAAATVPQGGWYTATARFSNATSTLMDTGIAWGVGDIISWIGQSNGLCYFQDAGLVTAGVDFVASDLVRQYTTAGGWAIPTKNGAVSFGNMVAGITGLPVGLHNGAVDASGVNSAAGGVGGYWLDATAGAPYPVWKTAMLAIGGKLAMVQFINGEGDAGAGISQAQHYADLQTLAASVRSDTGQASLPIVISQLGKTQNSAWTDAQGNNITQAQYQFALLSNNYLGAVTKDLTTGPNSPQVHFTAAAYTAHARRNALAALVALGYRKNSRGPTPTGWRAVSSTQTDVELIHRDGTDFTPASAISAFRVLDGGTPVATISAEVHQSARSIRLTHTAVVGTRTVDFGYGANPTVTGWPLDNSPNALPLEYQSFIPAGRTVTAVLQNSPRDSTKRASLSNLKWALHRQVTPDVWTEAPEDKGSTASTDASGNIVISANVTGLAGAVYWLDLTQSDGTISQLPVPFGNGSPVTLS